MKRILADIHLFETSKGGRVKPLPNLVFKCPLFFKGINELSSHGYDCRMLVEEVGREINPGDRVMSMPIIFLSPNEVFPHLFIGAKFDIWEAGVIGCGVVSSIEE
ncbi:hypothetical protein [Serratia fonticola]|uniref:Elongation factor Tu n=1 Tax=Serratia fonticola TaxID=47917 RepID=A0AAE7JTF0_SERFO|nr:hypothetical protein [Serratia fonticola]QKJ58576.1 hypothetical protein G9399_09600 [Serratia fonticola]